MPQVHVLDLAAERSQVQVLVVAAEQVDSAEIAGVGVRDDVAVAVEDAHAASFAGPCEVRHVGVGQFLSLLRDEYHGNDQPIRCRNGSILPIGARDTAANLAYPGITLVTLALVLSFWLLIFGVMQITLALRLRSS
jgi:hypothetical protein